MILVKTHILYFGVIAALLGTGYLLVHTNDAVGESFTGTATTVSSATTTTVGPDTVVTLFARNSQCNSRIVTTNEDAIHISFQDVTGFGSTTLSTNAGHYQAASTTVAYDSGIYGCGHMTALGLTASGTVTITETK